MIYQHVGQIKPAEHLKHDVYIPLTNGPGIFKQQFMKSHQDMTALNQIPLNPIKIQGNKMQPTNSNPHTYVNGTDVETHGYANTFLQ